MEDKSYIGEKPKIINVLDYKDVPDVEVSWLWEPFIPFGDVTIVEGDGMAGKTTGIIRLACMCSQGLTPPPLVHGELLEPRKIDPFHILYVGIEANNETEIKPAIRYGKGDINFLHYLDQSEHPFILTEEYVREAIKQSRCKLLIIDPYTNFLPSGVSLGNSVSMRRLMSMLMKVARETGAAIVLVGHLSKQVYGKAIYAGYGSGDIINTVRSVLLVTSDDHGVRYLRILKSNYFGVDAYFKVCLSMDDENCVQFEDYSYIVHEIRKAEAEVKALDGMEDIDEETKSKLTRTAQCSLRIAEVLSNGPVKRSEVYEILGGEGFSERTISRAFAGMDTRSYYEGRTVFWSMNEPDVKEDIDVEEIEDQEEE